MRHKLLTLTSLFISLLLSAFTTSAQDSDTASQHAFTKGSSSISAGLGIGFSYNRNVGYPNFHFSENNTTLPTFLTTYDYGLVNIGRGTLGIGGMAMVKAHSHDNISPTYGEYKVSETHYTLGARVSYHFHTRNPRLDPYAGIMLVGQIRHYKNSFGYSRNPRLMWWPSAFIGARYYFTKTTGMFLEYGMEQPQIRMGVSFKF